ncbi:hypothetical protein [Pseudomonas aeruginosa]|uniref:hypothetical protein n=1 Tax=Pseudomonas aeruginosa TaxID=287 RepID=UPI001C52FF63|nr:hypothetical protein [Pseudomonas aeruginosa]
MITNNSKAPSCTCPSGDGSLRHPCPAHPAQVEQAGDERVIGWRERILAAHPSSDPGFWPDALLVEHMAAEIADLRAALAQPSPVHELDPLGLAPHAEAFNEAPADALRPEQAEAERPEGPTEDELEAAGLGYPLHKEEAVKLWYSGFRSEVITVLEAWEAIGHDIGMNPDKGELLDSLRYMLEKCEAHDAALAEVAGLRSLLNSLLCYVERDIDRMRSDRDKSDNKEIYDRSISLAMERLKAAQNAVFTTEPGCDTAVELAAQTTQAQHSVPEISGIGRDAEHPRAVVLYLRNEPSEEDMRAIQNFLRAISADVLTQDKENGNG